MASMTLLGIDDRVAAVLKEKARKEGTSVNALMLRLLKESLGIDKKKRAWFMTTWPTWPALGAKKTQQSSSGPFPFSRRWTRRCGNR